MLGAFLTMVASRMEHKGNRRNLAIARPLLEVLFKAKGRTHAVTKEALRRTGDVINRLAKSTLLLKPLEALVQFLCSLLREDNILAGFGCANVPGAGNAHQFNRNLPDHFQPHVELL